MPELSQLNRDDINQLYRLRESDRAEVAAKLDGIRDKIDATAQQTREHVDEKLDSMDAKLSRIERNNPDTTGRHKGSYKPQALHREKDSKFLNALYEQPFLAVMVLAVVALFVIALIFIFKSPSDTERLLKAIQELRADP